MERTAFFPELVLALAYTQMLQLCRYGRQDECILAAILFVDQCIDVPQHQINAIITLLERSFASRMRGSEEIKSSILSRSHSLEVLTLRSLVTLPPVEIGLLSVVQVLQKAMGPKVKIFKSPQLLLPAIYSCCWRNALFKNSMESVAKVVAYVLISGCNMNGLVWLPDGESITPWEIWVK
jgi:hypothetical protein